MRYRLPIALVVLSIAIGAVPSTASAAGAVVGPSSVAYGTVSVTAGAITKKATVTTKGSTASDPAPNPSSVSIGGADASAFSLKTSSCFAFTSGGFNQRSCSYTIAFNPGRSGAHSASLVIRSDGTPDPYNLPLSGTGDDRPAEATVSPTSVNIVDSASRLHYQPDPGERTPPGAGCCNWNGPELVLTAKTGALPGVVSARITGPGAPLWTYTDIIRTCSTTALKTPCGVGVGFRGKDVGTAPAATLEISYGEVQKILVPLSATVTAPVASADDENFGTIDPLQSLPRTITVTNSGNEGLGFYQTWIEGPDAQDFDLSHDECRRRFSQSYAPTVPGPLAPGMSCGIVVRFNPGNEGAKAATLVVQSQSYTEDGSGLTRIALNGTGAGSPASASRSHAGAPLTTPPSSTGPTGPTGPAGADGAPGQDGRDGRDGRDATLICRATRLARVLCAELFAQGTYGQAGKARVTLKRAGKVFARGTVSVRTGKATIKSKRRLEAGRYRMVVRAGDVVLLRRVVTLRA